MLQTGSQSDRKLYVYFYKLPGCFAGELKKLPRAREDDESDLGVAEDSELVRLLEEPTPTFSKSHLSRGLVLDPANCNLASSHDS